MADLETGVPYHFKMGVVAEDRSNARTSAGSGPAISLKDVLRAFREWSSGSIALRVFFLGKAAPSDGVRVSLNGLVTGVDARNIVTVSGGGREIQLDLNVCQFSIEQNSIERRDLPQPFDRAPALILAFPNGAICLVVPGAPDSSPRHGSRSIGSVRWLRNKLAGPAAKSSPAQDPPPAPVAERPVKRNLCVDVRQGQASIVEMLESKNGATRIRRLREQFLSRADQAYADRLKRKIAYGENGGSYDLDGLYSARTVHSSGELLLLVEALERRDGLQAWDRRRYPR
jgi:hypothetical protein